MTIQWQIGETYTFNTRAPAILGTTVKNHVLRGFVDYDTACQHVSVDLLHKQIYPLLPDGTPSDPKKYTYLLLKNESGVNKVMATAWIDLSTVEITKYQSAVVTLPRILDTDIVRLREALTMLGHKGFTIEVTNISDDET